MSSEKCTGCNDSGCQSQARQVPEQTAAILEQQALETRMGLIKHKIMVLSGKGGVGKSTVAVNVAAALAAAGRQVGLLDIDIHGPSVPRLLAIDGVSVTGDGENMLPVRVSEGLAAMSIGLLLRGRDEAVIWRGPMKNKMIKGFLRDVEWGELDYLVVDSPPGTGDEPLSIAQLIDNADGALIVTTPQALAIQDVRRSIAFCRQLKLPVLGVIENMSGFTCQACGARVGLFGSGGGETMAREMGVTFLGSIPIDPLVVNSGDAGTPIVLSHPDCEVARAFGEVASRLMGETMGRSHGK
jgi:Mrp family chromosome partitioning ATPase